MVKANTPSDLRNEGAPSRRGFTLGLAAGFLLSGCASGDQGAVADPEPFEIIDFHAHALPPGLAAPPPPDAPLPPEMRQIIADMANPQRLIQALSSQGVDRRIVSVPLEAIPLRPGETGTDRMRRINDAVAALCAADDRLSGLATIEAYAGDAGAEELIRAIDQLGLVGCFVESANGTQLIADAVARPTLTAAAERGLPVFVHPVQDMTLSAKYRVNSFYQMNLGRAAITSVALAAMIESDVFESLPNLSVCFSSFAISALVLGGLFDMSRPDAKALLRKHVHVDTVGLSATMLTTMRDLVGIEHMLLGTDWPVFSGYSVRDRLIKATAEAGFSNRERALIASGNARRLFTLLN
ncbi:MAG: amidohydrolase family protein [Pseudomonadota bacterium]